LVVAGLTAALFAASGSAAKPRKPGYTYPGALTASDMTQASGTNWVDYGGNNYNQRYSTLNAINTHNVTKLHVSWQATLNGVLNTQTDVGGGLEYGGVYYYGAGNDDIFAFDSSTGKQLWEYTGSQQTALGSKLYGIAMGAGKIFFNEDDDYIVALNAKTGTLAWKVGPVGDPTAGETNISALEYSNGELFSGTAGSDSGVRGFISAYSAKDGHQLWKTFMVPAVPTDPGFSTWGPGGSSPPLGGGDWGHISTDPELGQIYVGTANAEPYANRPAGSDLFTSSTVALNMKTGKIVWHYQEVHHDEWDDDTTANPAVLIDYVLGGKIVHAIDQPTKMGLNFILNRKTGKPFKHLPIKEVAQPQSPEAPNNALTQPIPSGTPFAPGCATAQEWTAAGGTPTLIGPDGQPIQFGCIYTPIVSSHYTVPGWHDVADWPADTFSQQTGLMYVCDTINRGDAYEAVPVAKAKPGTGNQGFGTENTSQLAGDWVQGKIGNVVAINPKTNRPAWKMVMPNNDGCYSGLASTAGGVMFVGTLTGQLLALNSKTGKLLWTSPQLQGSIFSPPVIYQGLDGKEHVTLQTGVGNSKAAIPGNSVYSFTLPGKK
jgi:glucose dehydrogenase